MRKILMTIMLLSGWMNMTFAQQMTFNRLTTDNGLSQVSVNSLYVDENGLVWIATREGLNCYDGRNVKVFKLEKHNPNSLPGNTVTRLTGDGKGHLYLLCTEGLAMLDLRSLRFSLLEHGSIDAIAWVDDKLLTAHGNRIYRQGEKEAWLTIPSATVVSCIFRDSKGLQWIGTNSDGVYVISKGKSMFHPIDNTNTTSIYEDSKGNVWIGTWNNGLYIGEHQKNGSVKMSNLRHQEGNPNSLASNFVRTCCEDNEGRMWIGTFQGLNCYDRTTDNYQLYTQGNTSTTLSHQSVWCIVKDRQGTLWVGTYFGGVNYFNPEYEIFTYYRPVTAGGGLSSGIVGRMTEDDHHRLWICTEGGGVTVYDRQSGGYQRYLQGNGGLSENNVKAICYDKERHTMWIGTHLGGLNRLDMRTGKITVYRARKGDPLSLPSDIIRDIILYKDQLIVATQKGVCLFSPVTGTCSELPGYKTVEKHIGMVASICLDRQHRLWIAATGQGVYRYELNRRTWDHYQHAANDTLSLSSDNVNNIMEDSQGRIWLATAGCGLDLYLPQSNGFENYDHLKSGISSDCIYQVSESSLDKHHLLVITNQGLSVLDIDKKYFVNYGKNNGFPLSTVNENALYVTNDGEVFLGGMQGMVSFREQRLAKSTKPYRLFFSRLFVGGEEVSPGDATSVLRESMPYTREITLRHHQHTFSVDFSSTNHIVANEAIVSYQLKGLNDSWTTLPAGQSTVNFSNLPTGRYTLVLKTDREDILPAELTIRVLPPWYATWWARMIYLLLIAAAVYWLIRNYRERIRLTESLKYEKQHAQDIEEMNQSKLRFFTNISHEIRTPLTLIVGHTEMLMQSQRFLPATYNKLLGIYKSSMQLRSLITELLDFRKQEQGGLRIHVSQGNLYSLVYETFLLFKEYATGKNIRLTMKGDNGVTSWFDAMQLQKVVNNLIMNALKHTPSGGSVTVDVWQDDRQAHFSVTDTGEGIPPEEVDKIFDRFYQVDQLNSLHTGEGTGIGLALTKGIVTLHQGTINVESTVGKGSTFLVSLPLDASGFSEEMLVTEEKTQQDMQDDEQTLMTGNIEKNSLLPDGSDHVSSTDSSSSEKPTILIVEDNDAIRGMLVELFTPYYNIDEAKDGKEAYDKVIADMPDLVLSDVVMPRMTGTELCQKIKSDFSICHIPVVLLTARTSISYTMEGLKLGADDYVTKPYHSELLSSRCNNLVNNRRMLQGKFAQQPKVHAQLLATTSMDKKFLDEAMALIEAHYADADYSVENFARDLAMSRTALFVKWKSLTGQTPKNSILNYRLQKAADILKNNPEVPVQEVAYKCGFSTARYFTQCFKAHFKIQPTAFKE